MKWLKRVVAALGSLIVMAAAIGFFLPASYKVERSIAIDASAARIHAYVEDLTRWPLWEPWSESDPTIKIVLGATTKGLGANQSWSGDSGSGELTVTRIVPGKRLEYELRFDGGVWRSTAGLDYRPQGAGTIVTWWMTGESGSNPVARYFGLATDAMVGPLFERGLAKLKSVAETDGA